MLPLKCACVQLKKKKNLKKGYFDWLTKICIPLNNLRSPVMLNFLPSFPPSDQEHVGRLPPRCCRQRRLQEHLLCHHTRRGEGGVKMKLEDKKDNNPFAILPSLPCSFLLFLPAHLLCTPMCSAAHVQTKDLSR